jgi:pimeloyl-ACP methyl ester carboxylesterase
MKGKSKSKGSVAIWSIALAILLVACSSGKNPTIVPTEPPTMSLTQPPLVPTEAPVTEAPTVSEVPLSGLNADPQRVDFQAEDGQNLVGYYYPSKYANAPAVILMHWAGGDLCDWSAMSPWLQNRADENPPQIARCECSAGASLKDIFPPLMTEVSFGVFAFDFRGFGESKGGGSRADMPKDALAAFETVASFEGVDKNRIAAIGASIGADGAVDGCLLHNQKIGGGCVGDLSLSPGNYLGMNYASVVTDLAPIPVWCLAGELDGESGPTCKGVSGEHYRSQVYPASSAHGMMLLTSKLDPPALDLIIDFLEMVFGKTLK